MEEVTVAAVDNIGQAPEASEAPVKSHLTAESLSEQDRAALEIAKLNKKLALSNAEAAIAKNESEDMKYKYTVLQIFMKYSLTQADSIDETTGAILRGANNVK